MVFELLLLGLTFVVLGLASIEDWKTREIPDYLSYFFVAAAVLFRLSWAVYEGSIDVLIWIPVSLGIFFAFAYLMYRGGQWGGGDVKLMVGLGIALSAFPTDGLFPYFISFFMNVLIVGSLYGIVMLLWLGIKNREKLASKIGSMDKVLLFVIGTAAFLVIYFFRASVGLMLMGLLLVVALGLLRFLKLVEKNCMEAYIPISKLTEGDWLVKDVKVGKTVVKVRPVGLVEEDLHVLRKLRSSGRLDRVLIKVGVPFVPAFFFAFLATLVFGNLMIRFLSTVV